MLHKNKIWHIIKSGIDVKAMEIVKMDKQGRIVIPSKIRKKFKSRVFVIEASENEIKLRPLEAIKLTDLVDSIEVDVDDFRDTHKLRKAFYE